MGCKLGSTCVLLVNKAEIIKLITEFFKSTGFELATQNWTIRHVKLKH